MVWSNEWFWDFSFKLRCRFFLKSRFWNRFVKCTDVRDIFLPGTISKNSKPDLNFIFSPPSDSNVFLFPVAFLKLSFPAPFRGVGQIWIFHRSGAASSPFTPAIAPFEDLATSLCCSIFVLRPLASYSFSFFVKILRISSLCYVWLSLVIQAWTSSKKMMLRFVIRMQFQKPIYLRELNLIST